MNIGQKTPSNTDSAYLDSKIICLLFWYTLGVTLLYRVWFATVVIVKYHNIFTGARSVLRFLPTKFFVVPRGERVYLFFYKPITKYYPIIDFADYVL